MTLRINGKTLREALWGRESYGLLLVLLLVDYAILSLVNSPRWGGLARTAPVALTVLFTMHTSDAPRRTLRVAQVAVVLTLAVGVLQAATDDTDVGGTAFILVGALLVVSPVAILRRILPKETVDIESLFGAVDVYVIIGLIFSSLYIGIAHFEYAHHGTPFLAQPPPSPHQASDYVYLSFVTLTTVGFGDLTPLSDLARSVVVLEALLGQIFLVTLVARLVSLYSRDGARGRLVTREPSRRGLGGTGGDDGDGENPSEPAR
ncbi:MAG: potassium channel family protein [Acidimicrobiales bacterium]